MSPTAQDLRRMSREELDALFRRSPAGRLPEGPSRGTALILPGTVADPLLRGLVRALVWRGKRFRRDGERGTLKNLISPLSLELFQAEVYPDASWFSEGDAVILDYSRGSLLVRAIRDEIRQVGPGLWLGQVFWGKRRLILFMLEFPAEA